MLRTSYRRILTTCLVLAVATGLGAQVPPGYYDTVNLTNHETAHATLHDVIDDHTRYPYTTYPPDTDPDTWDILNLADEDPNDSARILDVYRNASFLKITGGGDPYNREHLWSSSYGFPNPVVSNYPYTDCHHLMLSDKDYNSDRGQKPFRFCNADCREVTTELNDDRGGGSGVYPGNSNWASGVYTEGTWEVWGGRRGDVARAIFYMAVRYEGDTHGITGAAEPDLRLTDVQTLIEDSNTGSNEATAYMGMYSDLLDWHYADPVDVYEIVRNEVVYYYQGNRNPFIDHPEWVACVFENQCAPDTTPPSAPTGLVAVAGNGSVTLTWNANTESDLEGYRLYRSTVSGGPYGLVYGPLLTGTTVTDSGLVNGTPYFYVLRAVDSWSNTSSDSNQASATPVGPQPGQLLLSEVFYDADGSDDLLEWVELYNAGSTPIDLATHSLGNGGASYTTSTVQLSGVVAPGATFVVGGPVSSGSNGNPTFDLVVDFIPNFQNSGTTADGVALFDVQASQISGAVPIDAVVYGGSNTNALIDETGVANPPEVGDASDGSSIERTDLAGHWQIQASPNPNATSVPGFCTAANGDSLSLHDDTVVGALSFEVCDAIEVGPSYEVAAPAGDLTLRAGRMVILKDGTSIETGCQLTVEIDSSLQVLP